jgi:hypothetical protein
MAKNYYVAGSWNVICGRCGFKFKSYELRKEWTGLMVCSCCYETRHPQDLIQVRPETAIPTYTRPEPTDTFLITDDPWMTETGAYIVDQLEQPFYTG